MTDNDNFSIKQKCGCKVSCQLTKQIRCLTPQFIDQDNNNNQESLTIIDAKEEAKYTDAQEDAKFTDTRRKNVSLLTVKRIDENIYSVPNKSSASRRLTSIKHIPSASPPSTTSSSSFSDIQIDKWSSKGSLSYYTKMAYTYVLKTGKYIRREIPYEVAFYFLSVTMIIMMVSLPISEPCLSSSSASARRDATDDVINNLKLSNHSSTSNYHVISLNSHDKNSSNNNNNLNTSASDHDFTATLINPNAHHIPREESSTLLVRDYLKVTKKSIGVVPLPSHGASRYDHNLDNLSKGPLANPATMINKIYPFYPHPFAQRTFSHERTPNERPLERLRENERLHHENEVPTRHDVNYYQDTPNYQLRNDPLPQPPTSFVPDIVYGRHDSLAPNLNSNNLASASSNGNYVSLPIPEHLKNATIDWFKKMTNANTAASDESTAKYTITGGRLEYKKDPNNAQPDMRRYDYSSAKDNEIDDDTIPSGYIKKGRMINTFNNNQLRPSSSRYSYSETPKLASKKKKQKCVCQEVDADDEIENMIESDPMMTGYVPMVPPPEMKATKVLKEAGIPIPPMTQSERRCLVYEEPNTIIKSNDETSLPLIRDYVNQRGERIVVPFPSPSSSSSSSAATSSLASNHPLASERPSNYNPLFNNNQYSLFNHFNLGGGQSNSGQSLPSSRNNIPVPSMTNSRPLSVSTSSKSKSNNWWDRMKILEPNNNGSGGDHSPVTSTTRIYKPFHHPNHLHRDFDYESISRSV